MSSLAKTTEQKEQAKRALADLEKLNNSPTITLNNPGILQFTSSGSTVVETNPRTFTFSDNNIFQNNKNSATFSLQNCKHCHVNLATGISEYCYGCQMLGYF